VLHRYVVEIHEHGWELLDVRIRIEGSVIKLDRFVALKTGVRTYRNLTNSAFVPG
jgi:hypothetical protein